MLKASENSVRSEQSADTRKAGGEALADDR